MDINTVNPNQFIDLFGTGGVATPTKTPGFVAGVAPDLVDILSTTETTTVPSTTETTTSTTETTTASASTTETTTLVNIFEEEEKGKPGRKPKSEIADLPTYFEDRIKSGKFVKIEEDAPDGSKKVFIPKTPEDFDEVFEIQLNYRLEQEKKQLAQQVYQSKSPAWQTVLKYSELVDDPSEIVPFIQGIKTIESVGQIDENTSEGAEKIVRSRLQQKGDTPELIDQQIEALRTGEKLIPTAKVYKPMIIQEEQVNLSQMIQEKQREEQQYLQMVDTIEKNAVQAIETPLFGKQKLSKEEKAIVYDMIAYPSEETKGYPIFSAIDELYEKGDFETLKIISLLAAGKKDAVFSYISSHAATATAAGLQRTLRVASTSSSSTGDQNTETTPVVTRRQYSGKFGR